MNCIYKNLTILFIFCCINICAFSARAQTWDTLGMQGFSAGRVDFTSIAVDTASTPYVVFDDSTMMHKASVMKYNGSSWVLVGSAGFSAGEAQFTTIAIDHSGTPYVAYEDLANGSKITVMKYNGSAWVAVGAPAFSAGIAHFPFITVNSAGVPYVVYEDFGNGQKATVMKYNGSAWVAVGSAGFSAGSAAYTNMVIDATGAPYVVYQDYVAGNKISVMKFNGSTWTNVGSAGFSSGTAYSTSIAIDGSGTPYVIYGDYTTTISGQAVCKKFNGTAWVTVGASGFSAGESYLSAMAIDAAGSPYAVYQDWSCAFKAVVMKYNGSAWVPSGSSGGISAGTVDFLSTTIDRKGSPYIVYQDAAHDKKATVMKLGIPDLTGQDTLCKLAAITLTDATAGGTWSSNNTAIATVGSLTGVVTGVAPGVATISYTVSGVSSTHTVTVNSCGITSSVERNTWSAKCSIELHPNPNKGIFTLNITSPAQGSATVIITNVMGRKIRELIVPVNTDISIQLDEPAGIYFITAIVDREILSKKILVD